MILLSQLKHSRFNWLIYIYPNELRRGTMNITAVTRKTDLLHIVIQDRLNVQAERRQKIVTSQNPTEKTAI